MRRASSRALAAIAVLFLLKAAPALADEPKPWPSTFTGRLQALALLETLDADLLGHDSATLTLERWCADHKLAEPPRVVAERVRDVDKPTGAEVRVALDVKPEEPLGNRRVRLKCGDHVLSEADNWYVPARLTPEARDHRNPVRQGGRRASLPLPYAVHEPALAPTAQGLGDGRDGCSVGSERARDSRARPRTPRDSVDARGRALSEVVETYTSESAPSRGAVPPCRVRGDRGGFLYQSGAPRAASASEAAR